MPIYAYRCLRCGEEFEKLILSAAQAGQVVCPRCQSEETERRPALFGLGGAAGMSGAVDSGCAPAVGGG